MLELIFFAWTLLCLNPATIQRYTFLPFVLDLEKSFKKEMGKIAEIYSWPGKKPLLCDNTNRSTAKLSGSKLQKNIFLLLLLNEVSLCKKLEHYLYSFTSGGLICKGWSILLSRLFSTTFPDVHCAKLAINYLIHSIEKQMTSFFKAYLCNFI